MNETNETNEARHRTLETDGVRLHVVEQGEGPLVLLVHGFPEYWGSWRHQLPALAGAGYRAVAIDVRGYGRSSAPPPIDAYRMLALVGDLVGLVGALGEDEVVLVGHDWGSPITWTTALLRPDLVRGLALLSVPYSPRGRRRPTDAYREMGGDEEFYINYFQQPGRAEAEIEQDVAGWLRGFVLTASGDAPRPDGGTMSTVPVGAQLRDRFWLPDQLPAWLPGEHLDAWVAEFERTGFTGGLNRYRNVDRDWEDLTAWAGRPITVPSLFVGGERDGPTAWGRPAIERFDQTLPALHRSVILDGAGHWLQQERPDEVNDALLDFLAALDGR